jgi:hypothetical protein
MPEIEFTINTKTGEMEMKVEGVQGPACSDIAKIATELLGTPAREENTREFYVQSQITGRVQSRGRK